MIGVVILLGLKRLPFSGNIGIIASFSFGVRFIFSSFLGGGGGGGS